MNHEGLIGGSSPPRKTDQPWFKDLSQDYNLRVLKTRFLLWEIQCLWYAP